MTDPAFLCTDEINQNNMGDIREFREVKEARDEGQLVMEEGQVVMEEGKVVEEGQPVEPGDTLVVGTPFVFAIQPQFKNKICENCFIYSDCWRGIQLCALCETVGYCSDVCRLADIPRHHVECGLVVARKRRVWPHRAWFVARAVLRVQREGWDEVEAINSVRSRSFRDLVDHYSDLTTDPALESQGWWYKEVKELLGDLVPELQDYLSIYGRLLVNSFALRVDNKGEEENVGTVLFRSCSIFDHSCQPSATTVYSRGRLMIKSLVSSPNMQLENFFISYLDEADTREARRAKLKNTWYFDCACPACKNDKSEEGKHSALCREPGCGGAVPAQVAPWKWRPCLSCGRKLEEEEKEKYQETYLLVRQVMDENGGEIQFTDVSEFLLRQMSDIFHSTDLDFMQAAMGAGQGYMTAKSWEKAALYQEMSIPGIRQHYSLYSGYLGPALQRLGEVLARLGRGDQARRVLQEAGEVLWVIPGRGHHLYTQYFLPSYNSVCRENNNNIV